MIEHTFGNLLQAPADALVNTVNTVGVMGKGVALQFRRAFPANYDAYAEACKRGEVTTGRMFVTEVADQIGGPRLIINFPTKQHWRNPSRLTDIAEGLRDLRRVLVEHDVESVAVPPLGCGLGGLDWKDVRPLIEAALDDLPMRILLYPPQGAPDPAQMRDQRERKALTPARASLIVLLATYLEPGARASLLEVQKLVYFLQESSERLSLTFSRQKYGPYADAIRHVLKDLEGQYITGFGDGTNVVGVALLDGAHQQAVGVLAEHLGTQTRIARVLRLIEGLSDPYSLELLATTHWVATQDGAADLAEVTRLVQEWSARKGRIFTDRHIEVAWCRLHEQGFLRIRDSTAHATN